MSAARRDDLGPDEREIIARAAAAAPPPPEPPWGAYHAELRARLDARRTIGARLRRWWARPAPIALSFGLAAALLLFMVQPAERRPDLAAVDETVLGARLGLIEHYQVVERLELLEDLDVIRQLDRVQLREG
jgi:hypothetical protein